MRREWNLSEHRRNERDMKWNGFTLKGDSWYGFDWYNNPIVITKKTMDGMVLIFMADGHQWHDKWIDIGNPCIPLYIQQQLYVYDHFKNKGREYR